MLRRKNRRRFETNRPVLPSIDWRPIAVGLAAMAFIGGAYAVGGWLLNRPVEKVVINGPFQRVSAIQLEGLVEPAAGAGFVKLDLDRIKGRLLATPWVARADVRRRWPATLEVTVTEERPVACWGQRGLLNPVGRLIIRNADHIPAELPRLSGPEGTEVQVTERFLDVQEQLEHRGLAAVEMALDNRGAWAFQLSNGIEIRLGAQDVDARIERFFKVFDRMIAAIASDVAYIDLRYPNGFAIGWKNREQVPAVDPQSGRPTGQQPGKSSA
jgi:cell division protein FtsQ